MIRAPVDGVITRRNIQVGQRVAPGTSMMMIVPLNDLYVDANFKESQLKKVRPGQPVTLTSDLYGDDVEYHGKVVGFSGGTGSAFALIRLKTQQVTGLKWFNAYRFVLHLTRKNLLNTHYVLACRWKQSRLICEVNAYENANTFCRVKRWPFTTGSVCYCLVELYGRT